MTPRPPGRFVKVARAAEAEYLTQVPNIGRSIAEDLRSIGIDRPADLRGKAPEALYNTLCRKTGVRQDPCVLDTFMAAVDFMNGGKPRPWWEFTPRRKALTNSATPRRSMR
jgi:hypothetical protein